MKKGANMIRKLLVVAAAIAMPLSLVALTGGTASANAKAGSAATDDVACTAITGTITFSPKLNDTGYTNEAVKTTVSATLTGCKATGSFKTTVTKGTVKGTITGVKGTASKKAGTCAGLEGSSTDTGTLTTTWTASPKDANSVLGVKSVTGATSSSGHGTFTIPGKVKGTASGSFLGSNHGASDVSNAETSDTIAQILSACKAGVSSLKIQTDPGKKAVSLG
jgi:hypothetical protein